MDIQEEIERYMERRDHYREVRDRLKTAYNKIKKDIKPDNNSTVSAYQKTAMDTGSWRGETLTDYEKKYETLKTAINQHKKSIDAAHDTINLEKADALDEYTLCLGKLDTLRAMLHNTVNG